MSAAVPVGVRWRSSIELDVGLPALTAKIPSPSSRGEHTLPGVVTQCLELAAQVVRADAGFGDQAGREVGESRASTWLRNHLCRSNTAPR
jgi:hypothetical protein